MTLFGTTPAIVAFTDFSKAKLSGELNALLRHLKISDSVIKS